jgi:heme/copper-type cytochrome/quinol oxidase subunit 2
MGDLLQKTWEYLTDMWVSLKTSIDQDKNWSVTNKNTGKTESRVWVWFKTFWIVLAIILISAFVIWNYIKPREKTSHHGWNRYGERY